MNGADLEEALQRVAAIYAVDPAQVEAWATRAEEISRARDLGVVDVDPEQVRGADRAPDLSTLHAITRPYVDEIRRLRVAIAVHRRDVEWAEASADPAAWREEADRKLHALVPVDEHDEEELDDAT